jgi:flagellar protein FlgJ
MQTEITSSISNTPNNMNKVCGDRLRRACKDFEAILIANMLKEMRKTIPKTGFLDSSYGSDIYRSMMDQKIAETMANEKGLGIGKILYKQLQKYCEER